MLQRRKCKMYIRSCIIVVFVFALVFLASSYHWSIAEFLVHIMTSHSPRVPNHVYTINESTVVNTAHGHVSYDHIYHQLYAPSGYHKCAFHGRALWMPLANQFGCMHVFDHMLNWYTYQYREKTFTSEVPASIRNDFSLKGYVHVPSWQLSPDTAAAKSESLTAIWSTQKLEQLIKAANEKADAIYQSSDVQYLYEMFDKFIGSFLEAKVLVIGEFAHEPWLEAMVLAYGALHVTTLQENNVHSKANRLTVLHPRDLATYWKSHASTFDIAVSFRDVAPAGVDARKQLCPNCDLLKVEMLACLLKPHALLFLAVPVGSDTVSFDTTMRRVYGRVRLPMLTSNWKLLDLIWDKLDLNDLLRMGDHQVFAAHVNDIQHTIFALQNTRNSSCV